MNSSSPNTTILVSGICNENIFIDVGKDRITLDGQAVATSTINGPDPNTANITIHARGVTIKRFTITGGRQGVILQVGGTATIDSNLIQFVGNRGVQLNRNAYAIIINNTIQNNPIDGILVSENSVARIGLTSGDAASASPNIIINNVGRGILVSGSSSARITGNTISGNTGDGIGISSASHADAASNDISDNGGDGIFVSENSGVNLGSDTGTAFDEAPNSTGAPNAGFGIRCTINSYGDGRFGTLTGTSGQSSFTSACINSVIP